MPITVLTHSHTHQTSRQTALVVLLVLFILQTSCINQASAQQVNTLIKADASLNGTYVIEFQNGVAISAQPVKNTLSLGEGTSPLPPGNPWMGVIETAKTDPNFSRNSAALAELYRLAYTDERIPVNGIDLFLKEGSDRLLGSTGIPHWVKFRTAVSEHLADRARDGALETRPDYKAALEPIQKALTLSAASALPPWLVEFIRDTLLPLLLQIILERIGG